ncbi:MAG TPA: hypothetical protein VFG09_11090, partial [Thermodesulfovibrionales bacterium]|nr:hypothetical protein [Thermodesulfovibrionales bacterium]
MKPMKDVTALIMAFFVVLIASGEAMAYFEEGHLIRVVYFNGTGGTGTGTEYLTDLGSITSFTSPSGA